MTTRRRISRLTLLTMAVLTALLVAKTGRDLKLHASQSLTLLAVGLVLAPGARVAPASLPPALLCWTLALAASLALAVQHGARGSGDAVAQLVMVALARFAPFILRREDLIRLAALSATTFIGVGGYALAQKLGLDPVEEFRAFHSRARPFSTFGNPDFLGAYCAFLLPLLADLRRRAAGSRRHLLTGIGVLATAVLGWTGSRGAWLGAAAGLAIWVMLSGVHHGLRTRVRELISTGRLPALLLAGATTIALVGWWAAPHLTRRTDRAMLWTGTARMIAARPLAGWGPGAFAGEFPPFAPPAFAERMRADNTFAEHPHSEYLHVAVEYGLPALGIFLWLLTTIIARGARLAGSGAPLAAGAAGALAAILVHMAVDRNFRLASTAAPFWLLAGALWAPPRRPPPAGIAPSPVARALGFASLVACLAGAAMLLRPLRASYAVAADVDFLKQDPNATSAELLARQGQLGGQPQYWVELGNTYAKEEKFAQAADAFTQALRLDPTVRSAKNNLGNCYFYLSRFDDAAKVYLELLAEDPEHRDARFNLAMAYYYQRRIKEALIVVDEILRREPGNAKAIALRQQLAP